jgi:transposase
VVFVVEHDERGGDDVADAPGAAAPAAECPAPGLMEAIKPPGARERLAAVRKYPEELRQRAIRLVRDADDEPGTSRKQACRRVGQQLGISAETLRGWVNRAEIDDGDKPGITTQTTARIAELEREVRELRRANAILKSASAFFAAELCATRRDGIERW